MIQEKKYYSAVCDNCKKVFEHLGHTILNSSGELNWLIKQEEWHIGEAIKTDEIITEHFCPDCYEIEQETGDLIILHKNRRPKK